jgi:hypothetical protein
VVITVSGKAEVGLGIKLAARSPTAANMKPMVRGRIWDFAYVAAYMRNKESFPIRRRSKKGECRLL